MKKSKILIILLLSLFLFTRLEVYDAQKAKDTFGDVLDELEALKKEKEELERQKQLTEAERKKVSNEAYQIGLEVQNLTEEIYEANKKIDELEDEIVDKKEETDNILVFLQLSNGEKAYLEYIFEAKSFTDFIHRISIVEQISKYNKELIKEMNELIKQNNELKAKNEENIKVKNAKKEELNQKLVTLDAQIDKIESDEPSIDSRINDKEKEIESYRENGCSKRSDPMIKCLGGLPISTGFIRPFEQGKVTSEFSWRISPITGELESHSGIDLTSPQGEGTPIHPVANGIIGGKVYRSSCGGNMLYIYHTINGEEYTSVYMHLLKFNEDFKIGDIILVDDTLGWMGGQSTKKSNGGYDNCTTAAHLHLTLAEGHTMSHRKTMFDPRLMIYFPKKGAGYWYGRTW